MPEDKRLIRTIRLRNLLSFGPNTEPFELGPLNVLIGPNASGKSNLIDAIGFLKAAPTDLTLPIRRSADGISEWLWKGGEGTPTAEIEVSVSYPDGTPLRHKMEFTEEAQRLKFLDESIRDEPDTSGKSQDHLLPFHVLPILSSDAPKLDRNRSALSQVKDPIHHSEITYLVEQYPRIAIYRDWDLGHGNRDSVRREKPTDMPADFLEGDASNLGLVLNDLDHRGGAVWDLLHEKIKSLHGRFSRISTRTLGGTIQVFLHEDGLKQPIPATRLSDGTLRYLCLLAILCHPEPPPLICIEEPEIGLHPDLLPTIADLLVEASQRTQIIVTTHSDILVDALTETPEAVVVCEKEEGSTVLRRLDTKSLSEWLKEYSLGNLWIKGELGGKRW